MPIQYPGTIPDLLTRFGINPLDFTSYTDLLRELQALFNAAGTNPAGSGGTMDGRMDAIELQLAQRLLVAITSDSAAVSNTATETAFSNGNLNLAANAVIVGRVYRVTAGGIVSTKSASPGTLIVNFRWGNTLSDPLILSWTTNANPITASLVNSGWYVDGLLTIRSLGSAGTLVSSGMGETDPLSLTLSNAASGLINVNTTIARTLQLYAKWSLADPTNTITLRTFTVEQVN